MSKIRAERRREMADEAASRLFAGERALDGAIHEVAMMCAQLPKMRLDAQLAATVGQEAFTAAAAAHATMVQSRAHLVELHHALSAVHTRLNLPPLAVPGLDKPPPGQFAEGPPLRAVS